MKLWILIGSTESCDEVGPYVWTKEKPSEEQVEDLLSSDWTDDWEAGLVYWSVEEITSED